jgi:hypothetical protein
MVFLSSFGMLLFHFCFIAHNFRLKMFEKKWFVWYDL